MVGLNGGHLSKSAPESGHTITRLSTDHSFRPQVNGGVRIKLKDEKLRVFVCGRQFAQLKRFGHPRALDGRRLCQHSEGAKEFHA